MFVKSQKPDGSDSIETQVSIHMDPSESVTKDDHFTKLVVNTDISLSIF